MSANTFFSTFSNVDYDFTRRTDILPNVESITNLLQRTQLSISKEDILHLCTEYIIPEGMKPEQLAYSLYNDPLLHWTILFINDIPDIISGWPISDLALMNFVTSKYGVDHEYDTHHFEKIPEGISIDYDFCVSTYNQYPITISNYEYESRLNELKRYIKVIDPQYIATFIKMWQAAQVS